MGRQKRYIGRTVRQRDLKKRAKPGTRHRENMVADAKAPKSKVHFCDPETCSCAGAVEFRNRRK